MNRPLKTVMIGALLSSLAVVSAYAQAERASRGPDARPRATLKEGARTSAAPAPEVVAQAPNARLAALIRRDLVIQRNKNVANVRRIDVGVYCVRPTAASGITPSNSIVMLTPEYFYSLYNEVKVQWASTQSGCTANEIGVYTFADVNFTAEYTFSNAVSFSIYVP